MICETDLTRRVMRELRGLDRDLPTLFTQGVKTGLRSCLKLISECERIRWVSKRAKKIKVINEGEANHAGGTRLP